MVSLLASLKWPMESQGVLAGAGICDKAMSRGGRLGGEDLCDARDVGAG